MGVAAFRSSPLRIGLVAPPSVRVPPRRYGGTELVIDQLARGLVAAGHDVTLFTTGDSTCPVDRRWVHRKELGTNAGVVPEFDHIEAAYEELSDVDLVHDHTLLGPLWSHALGTVTPVVTTAHLPFTPELTRPNRRPSFSVLRGATPGHSHSATGTPAETGSQDMSSGRPARRDRARRASSDRTAGTRSSSSRRRSPRAAAPCTPDNTLLHPSPQARRASHWSAHPRRIPPNGSLDSPSRQFVRCVQGRSSSLFPGSLAVDLRP